MSLVQWIRKFRTTLLLSTRDKVQISLRSFKSIKHYEAKIWQQMQLQKFTFQSELGSWDRMSVSSMTEGLVGLGRYRWNSEPTKLRLCWTAYSLGRGPENFTSEIRMSYISSQTQISVSEIGVSGNVLLVSLRTARQEQKEISRS